MAVVPGAVLARKNSRLAIVPTVAAAKEKQAMATTEAGVAKQVAVQEVAS